MLKTFAAFLATALASGAVAQTTSNELTLPPVSVKDDSNKIVCKKEEQIGTRLGAKKVCMTVADWQRIAQLNREETERAQINAPARSSN